MLRSIYRTADGQTAIVFVVFGALVAIGALQYPVGSPARMGPGFFPLCLGLLLIGVGLIVGVQSLRSELESQPAPDWRALAIITVAVLLAGALLLTVGLLVAVPVLVIVSSLAARNVHWLWVSIAVLALTAAAYVIFIWGLGLHIPLFRV